MTVTKSLCVIYLNKILLAHSSYLSKTEATKARIYELRTNEFLEICTYK